MHAYAAYPGYSNYQQQPPPQVKPYWQCSFMRHQLYDKVNSVLFTITSHYVFTCAMINLSCRYHQWSIFHAKLCFHFSVKIELHAIPGDDIVSNSQS